MSAPDIALKGGSSINFTKGGSLRSHRVIVPNDDYDLSPAISFDQCLELFKEMKNAPIGAHVATEEYRSLLKALYQRMEMEVQMVSYEGREG